MTIKTPHPNANLIVVTPFRWYRISGLSERCAGGVPDSLGRIQECREASGTEGAARRQNNCQYSLITRRTLVADVRPLVPSDSTPTATHTEAYGHASGQRLRRGGLHRQAALANSVAPKWKWSGTPPPRTTAHWYSTLFDRILTSWAAAS